MFANWSKTDIDGGQYTEPNTLYNEGYRDGVKAEKERNKAVAAQIREECAKACEAIGDRIHGQGREDSEAYDCADFIRSIKP